MHEVLRNNEPFAFENGIPFRVQAGERIKLVPGVWHNFWPTSNEAIIGEVSTENNDQTDNLFLDAGVGRFPEIEEDEEPAVRLASD